MKLKTTFITLNEGTEICAPANPALMTNFVLKEQGDWFEDEINFVRKFIKPGMQALDIGANYGLYSTAIAKSFESDGKLWCFEPTPNTADALRKTINRNKLSDSIELIQAGLSDHIGQATFYTSPNAELNSLTTSDYCNEEQTIDLLTLDSCLEKYQWKYLDFIKLDAEGEELNILKQAHKTLSTCSPLVMFELKHGKAVNTPLIGAFSDLGFKAYYLIPGLNMLAPFELTEQLDGFRLNLFCCKEDTAKKLVDKGHMVLDPKPIPAPNDDATKTLLQQFEYPNSFSLAYDSQMAGDKSNYQQAFDAYACSRSDEFRNEERLSFLLYAFDIVKKTLDGSGNYQIEQLSAFARISYDIGERTIGNSILGSIIQKYMSKVVPFTITNPFVPPGKEFEQVSPDNRINDWIYAAVLDQLVRKQAFSCYFSGAKGSGPYYNALEDLNFMLPDMLNRKMLVQNLELARQA